MRQLSHWHNQIRNLLATRTTSQNTSADKTEFKIQPLHQHVQCTTYKTHSPLETFRDQTKPLTGKHHETGTQRFSRPGNFSDELFLSVVGGETISSFSLGTVILLSSSLQWNTSAGNSSYWGSNVNSPWALSLFLQRHYRSSESAGTGIRLSTCRS